MSESPPVMALSTAGYLLVPSVACLALTWSVLFKDVTNFAIYTFLGLIGAAVLYGLFIHGWRFKLPQFTGRKEQVTDKKQTISRTKLLHNMSSYFDLGDIGNICFHMGIDYEALSGDDKVDKIRDLILLCERTGRYDELIDVCKQERPNIAW